MFEDFLASFVAMSVWEYVAAILSIMYVFLAVIQNSWCWPAAFVSTLIYTILFWQGALPMESFLNFYYMVMAIYGYIQWRGGIGSEQASDEPVTPLKVTSWAIATHVKFIGAISVITLIVGYLLDTYTQANLAYLDTFTTVFALFATYLLTQKVLENWLYWVVIDIASLFLYTMEGYYVTTILFVFYIIFAVQGFISWRKEYQLHHHVESSLH